MKNLVVCCDGTWKSADDKDVSNIEKIARAVDPTPADKPMQIVYYAPGVGTGATRFEKLAGGAFGLGLDAAIIGAYRFLSLNFQEGDQIYIFGFSRGAYTARSLAGMINTVGLLQPEGLVKNKLPDAMPLYRGRPPDDAQATGEWLAGVREFRTDCYEKDDKFIRFLGVFDTVGTLGVPGLTSRKYRFHNVALTPQVATARHALAIHERRRAFAPALWTQNTKARATDDVKQVWFDGVHSDVGGGYREAGLSNRALKWMVDEAADADLVFVPGRLDFDSPDARDLMLHNSLKRAYRLLNFLSVVAVSFTSSGGSFFKRGWRILERPEVAGRGADLDVDLASDVYRRWVLEDGGSVPVAGVKRWIKGLGRERFEAVAKGLRGSESD